MLVSIIAAIDKNLGLSYKGSSLVHLPPDLDHFRKITQWHIVVMGRKTYEIVGGALPNRRNIVLSKNKNWQAKDVQVMSSPEKAIDYAKSRGEEEIFFIGGASIYKQSIKFADKLYLTLIDKKFEADTYFPVYDEFTNLVSESDEQEYEGTKFKYIELTK